MIYISRDVYNRIWEYYLNVYRKYSNTWTYNKSITFFRWISSFCRAISSKSVYCKTPFLREWRRLGLTQIYFKETNWYFGFKEDGGDIYVYKCEYGDCMHDNESNCEIKRRVESGEILKSRYDNYLKFIKKG